MERGGEGLRGGKREWKEGGKKMTSGDFSWGLGDEEMKMESFELLRFY
jgi:hypothetical protein